jgi:hypothetical protein
MLAALWLESSKTYTVIFQGAEEHADDRVSPEVCLVSTIIIVSVELYCRACKLLAHRLAKNTL